MAVPKPPAFDAQTSAKAWTEGVLKPDGTPYAAFGKFPAWKQWADNLRDNVQANEIAIVDHKGDIDKQAAEIGNLEQRVAALEAQPQTPPFPA